MTIEIALDEKLTQTCYSCETEHIDESEIFCPCCSERLIKEIFVKKIGESRELCRDYFRCDDSHQEFVMQKDDSGEECWFTVTETGEPCDQVDIEYVFIDITDLNDIPELPF